VVVRVDTLLCNLANGWTVKLPHGENADLGTKIEEYVLNPRHWEGRHKARVFESVLGITLTNQDVLRQAILAAAENSDEAESLGDNGYGEVYVLRFVLRTHQGRATVLRHGSSDTAKTSPV
jgi:hypothetical protein